ncbi:MAG: PIN domain nuclease [Microbacterium sp.]|nr:MAG: PIN domain nuclease [Microbacterium sp.]
MRLLLDTHVLLWWLADAPELGEAQRRAIANRANEVYVSAVSVAEVAIKASLGKLDAPGDLAAAAEASGFAQLPFTALHAEKLRDLPWHHRDPFDRMLVCQALAEGLTLMSNDRRVAEYFGQ